MSWFDRKNQVCGKDKWRIAQITDCHLLINGGFYEGIDSVASLRRVLQALAQQQWDCVIVTGDISQDHTDASYQLLSDLCNQYLPDTLLARLAGNHDDLDCLTRLLNEPVFTPANHLSFGQWQILLVNSKGPTPAGFVSDAHIKEIVAQLSQFDEQLNVGVFCHHHPLPMKAYIDKHILTNGEQLLNCLAPFKQVRFLAHGHVHQDNQIDYPRYGVEDIPVLATPSTSMQFKANDMNRGNDDKGPAYRWFELSKDGQMTTGVVWLDS